MSAATQWLDKALYPNHSANWDNLLFRSVLLQYLQKGHHILDLGAGVGIVPQMNFRGLVEEVCGVDPDSRILMNPYLDEAKIATGEGIPYPDTSFDLVFSNSVLEHLEDPDTVLREVKRVLKPRGLLAVKTPNRCHYVPMVAKLTPHSFHAWINKVRGRKGEDTFPTYYRANSARDLRSICDRVGLSIKEIQLIEGRPEYLRISSPTYVLGAIYERIVNLSNAFAPFRVLLIAIMEKPGD